MVHLRAPTLKQTSPLPRGAAIAEHPGRDQVHPRVPGSIAATVSTLARQMWLGHIYKQSPSGLYINKLLLYHHED